MRPFVWCTQCKAMTQHVHPFDHGEYGCACWSQVLQTLLNCAACVASQTDEASNIGALLFHLLYYSTESPFTPHNLVLLHKRCKWLLDLAWDLLIWFVNKSRNLTAIVSVVLLAFWHLLVIFWFSVQTFCFEAIKWLFTPFSVSGAGMVAPCTYPVCQCVTSVIVFPCVRSCSPCAPYLYVCLEKLR